jgi:hypothetical protein
VEYGSTTLPLVGQRQQRCPTGGQEDCGTAEDGVTAAVRFVDDFLPDAPAFAVVPEPLFSFSFCPTSMV